MTLVMETYFRSLYLFKTCIGAAAAAVAVDVDVVAVAVVAAVARAESV